MTTREKIIISFVGIAVVYVIYSMSSDKKVVVKRTKDRNKVTSHLNNLVNDIITESEAQDLSSLERHIISQAEKEDISASFVSKSVFTESLKPKEKPVESKKKDGKEKTEPKVKFTYTGFIEMGRDKMAVINGAEYKEGEQVGKYEVKKIDASHVLLLSLSGKNKMRTINFDEGSDGYE